MDTLYTDYILEKSKSTQHRGSLVGERVFSLRYHNPVCGDFMTIYIQTKENGEIERMTYDIDGCAISCASAHIYTDYVIGKRIEEIKKVTAGDVHSIFGVAVSPARAECVLLVHRALQALCRENRL